MPKISVADLSRFLVSFLGTFNAKATACAVCLITYPLTHTCGASAVQQLLSDHTDATLFCFPSVMLQNLARFGLKLCFRGAKVEGPLCGQTLTLSLCNDGCTQLGPRAPDDA